MNRKPRKSINLELRNNILSMISSERYTLKEISDALNISLSAIKRVQREFRSGVGFVDASVKRKNTWYDKTSEFSDIDQIIYNSISVNNCLSQNELSELVSDTQSVTLSASTICRKLKKMGFTRKRLSLVPLERNTSEQIDARAIYATDMARIPDENLVFLDETGFNFHTRRSYGFSSINHKAYMTVPGNRGTNRSLLCAIGKEGVIDLYYWLFQF